MNAKGRKGDGVRKNRDGMVTGRRQSRHKIFIFTVQKFDIIRYMRMYNIIDNASFDQLKKMMLRH